jgi:PAS domain S-box-containing protein
MGISNNKKRPIKKALVLALTQKHREYMKRVFQASFNGFHIDSDRGISFRGELLPLRPKERAALIYLVQHAGKLIRKEELVAQVWNGAQTSDESIARCISVIRSQLQQANPGAKILIKNEYGHGYRFIGEVSDSVSYISEESFYALINASPDFIALKDGEGRWQIVNQTGIQLFNLEHQTWREKTDLELMDLSPPECHDSFLACIVSDEAAWRSGQPYQSIEIVPTADDGMHVFEVTKSPLFYDDGSRKALVILGRDVTQTLRAVEQNTLSAKVLANSHEGVLITNASNEIISINDAFTKTTGYTVEELIGKNPRILSSDRHGSDFYQTMWRQINVEG